MENIQFEISENKFKCVQCNTIVHINDSCCKIIEENPEGETSEISCPKCGVVYIVGKNPESSGYIVTEKTNSTTELEEVEEENIENE